MGKIRMGRGGGAIWALDGVSWPPDSCSPELRSARPTTGDLGREEFKTERRASGFSPARSRSKERCVAMVVAAASLSAQRCPSTVCLGGPPDGVRGKMVSWRPDDAPCLDGRAWKAIEASRRRREVGLEFVSSGIGK
jgi:hypothetical protein